MRFLHKVFRAKVGFSTTTTTTTTTVDGEQKSIEESPLFWEVI